MVVTGGLVRTGTYPSDVLLSAGVTIALVGPIFAIERQLEGRLKSIATELSELQKLVRFRGESEQQFISSISTMVGRYSGYLDSLGLPTPDDIPTIEPSDDGTTLQYDPSNSVILVPTAFAHDTNAVLVQYTHHVLLSLPGRAQEDLGYGARAVAEALNWLLVCSFTRDPIYRHPTRGTVDLRVSRPFRRDDYDLKFKPYSYEMARQLAEGWAAIFWKACSLLPPEAVCAIVVSAFAQTDGDTDDAVWSHFAAVLARDARWGVHHAAFVDLLNAGGVFLAGKEESAGPGFL